MLLHRPRGLQSPYPYPSSLTYWAMFSSGTISLESGTVGNFGLGIVK